MAILSSDFGDISYSVVRRKNMKNIRITVKNDGSVCVSASAAVALTTIEKFVSEKAEWIIKARKKAAQKAPETTVSELSDGDLLNIFGEKLTLKIVQDVDEKTVRNGDLLLVFSNSPANSVHTAQLLMGYLAEIGRARFSEQYDFFIAKSGYKGIKPRLRLKLLKSKWGHCDRRNNEIMLNFALCCLPEQYLAYVAAHEVAHLFVPNHSAQFYAYGESLLPDFKRLNKELSHYSTSFWGNLLNKN